MCQIILHLQILSLLCCSAYSLSCPEKQIAFRNSCYEFVDLQLSFFSSQEWCEKNGGHLIFITDAETQHFLQSHLDAEKDAWIGAAASSTAEGSLSWLDGSFITYSYWAHSSHPGGACAHILKKADYRWKSTDNCQSMLYFICQFAESGTTIVSPDHSTALRCGSGEVIMIDGGFFGQNSIRYPHSTALSPAPPMMRQCSSVDIVNLVRAQCQDRQVCTITGLQSWDEPCPWLGSYLSVKYHCKEGIVLSIDPVATVFNAVTINIKWVLDFTQGDLTCSTSLGDGHIIYQHGKEGLESSIVHIYTHPNSFLVAVECTSHKVQVTAQKVISVQEPVTAFGEIKCHTEGLSFNATDCKALIAEPFQLQLEVKAGSHVTYRVQSQDIMLTSLFVLRGNVSHNISLTLDTMTQLGPGCHQLSLYASNMVTFPEVSTKLQVCVLEKISGLKASVLEGRSLYSSYISVRVTLEHGTPVLLHFILTGEKKSVIENRQMTTKTETYQIGHKVKGLGVMKLRAWNAFSFSEVDVSNFFQNVSFTRKVPMNQHFRVSRSPLKIIAEPSASVKTTHQHIVLSLDGSNSNKIYKWSCSGCKCMVNAEGETYIITTQCLPPPFHYNKYESTEQGIQEKSASICVILKPEHNSPDWLSLKCFEGCKSASFNKDIKLKMECPGQERCPDVVWNIKEVRSEEAWEQVDAKSCYTNREEMPLIEPQTGGTEYTVKKSHLKRAKRKKQDVKVIITNGKHLRCSKNSEVKSVFLPLGDKTVNYKLQIIVTAENHSFELSTTVTTQVEDFIKDSSSSGTDLEDGVKDTVAQLKSKGRLSAETVGPLLFSVTSKLNDPSDTSSNEQKKKVRKQLLGAMMSTVNEAPMNSLDEVLVMASGLNHVIQKGSELSDAAQEDASLLLENLSLSLLNMSNSEENKEGTNTAAGTIVEGTSTILDYTSNKNVSQAVVRTLSNIQRAVLAFKSTDEGPTVIQQGHISVFVNRVLPDSLHKASLKIPNCSCASFSLQALPSHVASSKESVDVQMLSLDKNPFLWNPRGNISGPVAALSLAAQDGSSITVQDLTEDIEILLPSPTGQQVTTSVLDLRNYSTSTVHVPSDDITLVIKMLPSEDLLPFKVYLGHMKYPTDTNYVAMTEMPHHGGTFEEKYTWLMDPKMLKGNTGLHYLLVRPIVGPGIKSINASLYITIVSTMCKFWNESLLEWSHTGCRVGIQTTPLSTQCLCNHLTFFGGSFFVTPNLVDPSRSAELFATFTENPVVVCFVGALFVAYLLVVVWARRKDIHDTSKVKVTVLNDNDPMDEYQYLLSVSTGHRRGASTSSQVAIILLGSEGNSGVHHLTDPKRCVFERGAVDMFLLMTQFCLGDLQSIRLWHNNSGSHPAWFLSKVIVQDIQKAQKWHFICNSWLSIDMDDCSLDKVFPVSSDLEIKRFSILDWQGRHLVALYNDSFFSNLFFMKTSKDFSDGHLWYSVISRPPSSPFTCVQRVSCCFSLLLCTMLTSIMFYGIPTDPSEQTMDLGHFEFTWQQFMIGVQSSLIMFPVNILMVSIFRHTRSRENPCCKCGARKAVTEMSFQPATPSMNTTITLDTVIKDITRIAHSLTKTVKNNIPCDEAEFRPGQDDINGVLSVIEDFIRQKKNSDTSHCKTNTVGLIPDISTSDHPGTIMEGIQMKSNKIQYLYQQLCRIDVELGLLQPTGFSNPLSYSHALQQIQDMKAFLEDQLFTASGTNPDQTTHKLKPSVTTSSVNGQRKQGCCHGGLPWWFVFIGWLLVAGTSVVAGYFTMLYGLKFGKERSVSWLVSMIVSFFQSVFIIQPLKVLCFGIFFALVIKKVEDENFENVQFSRNNNAQDHQMVRKDTSLYEPPPPADVEKMKMNKTKEQRAFMLLTDILTYMGFMWMLLLVAYGQRDPNAFYLNRHIRNSFSSNTSHSMSLSDVFTWANTSLLHNLFGVYPGFITDGNSRLVGSARLRQLRVQVNSCHVPDLMLLSVPGCHAPYSWDLEDSGSYDPGWNRPVNRNADTDHVNPWTYQTQAQLKTQPVWGNMDVYRGGGFIAELGPTSKNASRVLEYLFRNKWLDMQTRAVFAEFTVYNANVNLFSIVTLLFENNAIGGYQFESFLQSIRLYQSTGGLHIFVMAAEIIYLLFILYYMFVQGKLMKMQRWSYFKSKWNLLELTIILLSWAAVAAFIKRTLIGNRDLSYYQKHRVQFASFYETASADTVLQTLISFLVLLSTIKLWHLFRLNPKMNMITATLQRAWTSTSGFLVIIVIMSLAYSISCNIIYGWKLYSYKTFLDALMTIICLQIGIFNYSEVMDQNPALGAFLIGSCIVFMAFVMLNLFISVILVAFNEEQIYHKPSEEEEIVDLLLKKICSAFGIRYDHKSSTQEHDGNCSADFTLNSKNKLNNSALDVDVLQMCDSSVQL